MSENKEILFLPFSSFKIDDVLGDFNCSLLEDNSLKGHLLINEHRLGFVSENKEKAVSFNFNEIKKITLNEEKIEIENKNEHKINFVSFDDFNSAFDKINSIFKLCTENESKDEKSSTSDYVDSGESNNDNEENNKRPTSSKFSSNSSNDTSVSSSKNVSSIKKTKRQKRLNENKSTKNIRRLFFEKEAYEEKPLIRNKSSKKLTIGKKMFSSKTVEKKIEKPIIPEKIIFKAIDKNLDEEICKKVINMPPKEFFEKYQTNKNPETSYAGYYKWVGEYSEIEVGNWEKIKTKENGIEKFQRNEKFCIALHGVPLINKSHVEKTCTYWIDKDGTYYMNTLSVSKGVPLADKFTVETNLEFYPYMNNTKTVFRCYVRTNIIKWTLFKFALISQGKKTFSQEVDKWFKFIEEKGDKIIGDYCI